MASRNPIASLFGRSPIGANDVANAMGTSVGSRALTITQAIPIVSIKGWPVSTTHSIVGSMPFAEGIAKIQPDAVPPLGGSHAGD